MEAEKLAQEKTEIQRQYIMVCTTLIGFALELFAGIDEYYFYTT